MTRLCTVTIEGTSQVFECGDQYVLDAAISAGVQVPYNCRGGACGTCKAEVLEGAVEHGWVMGFAISDEEQAQGKCLICSSKPTSERLRLRMLNRSAVIEDATVFIPREYSSCVVAAYDVTPAVRLVTVQMPADESFRFDAGMYMELLLEGVEPSRPYSIVTAPLADGTAPGDMISFLVVRHEFGLASRRLHAELCVGDALRVRGPYGTFRLPQDQGANLLLLGGGTGLAPLVALASRALEVDPVAPVELWFSTRTRRDVFYVDELQRLAHRHANFSYQVFLSRAGPAEILPASWHRGRLTQQLPERLTRAAAGTILIAGSPEFVRACADCALASGARPETVISEAYEPKLPLKTVAA
jgi:CDP-4-dehydro-6-deoxyglucose reductase, E3